MDNPLFLVTKGLKAKKKRLGGGGGGSGAFPTGSSPHELGIVSFTEETGSPPFNTHTMASVFIRDSATINPSNGNPIGHATVKNSGGTNINSVTQPEINVADYIATILQGETAPNTDANSFPHLAGTRMERGEIQISTNNFTEDIFLMFMFSGYNQSGSFNQGSGNVNLAVNTSNLTMTLANPNPFNIGGSTPISGRVDITFHTSLLSSQHEIILEFKADAIGKAGTGTTATTSPIAGATKVGSCYLKIVFTA